MFFKTLALFKNIFGHLFRDHFIYSIVRIFPQFARQFLGNAEFLSQ